MRKIMQFMAVLLLLCLSCGCTQKTTAVPETTAAASIPETTAAETTGQTEISVVYQLDPDATATKKYGSLVLTCTDAEFNKTFALGDIIRVELPGTDALRVPVCGAYDDVSAGELLIRMDTQEEKVILAINGGQLGVKLGFIREAPDGSAFRYEIVPETFPKTVTITVVESGGYADRIAVGKLAMANEKTAYPNLTDEEFANFRDAACGSMATGIFFRASSPIDPKIGRNADVDRLVAQYGIQTIYNLADSAKTAEEYPGVTETNYNKCDVTYLKMGMALGSKVFDADVVKVLQGMAEKKGPYLIHCTYGKDRTGFVCALVQALCGASLEEVQDDYLLTYRNLYDVVDGTQQPVSESCQTQIREIIRANLSVAFGVEVNADNLNTTAEDYARRIGLTDAELEQLRSHLCVAD